MGRRRSPRSASGLAAAGATGDDVVAVGLTGQMHGLVLLDAADRVLRPAILWNDQRTAAECDAIRAAVGRERLIEITGNDALTGFTAPKLVWVRDHEPEVWARAAHVLLPKDYLRLRLTGDHALDKADGAGTHAVRPRGARLVARGAGRAGDPGRLAATDLRGSRGDRHDHGRGRRRDRACGPARRSSPVAATSRPTRSASASSRPGEMALSLGTSGVVFAATDRPLYDPRGHRPRLLPRRARSVAHDVGDALGGREPALVPRRAGPGEDFGALVESAAGVEAATDGLFFLPYLTGERSPHPDPYARGAFVGLTVEARSAPPRSGRSSRASRSGLRDGLDLMLAPGCRGRTGSGRPAAGSPARSGGRSWRTCSRPRSRPSRRRRALPTGPRSSPRVGAGWFTDVETAVTTLVRVTPVAEPGADAEAYRAAHARFRALYPALAPTFDRP